MREPMDAAADAKGAGSAWLCAPGSCIGATLPAGVVPSRDGPGAERSRPLWAPSAVAVPLAEAAARCLLLGAPPTRWCQCRETTGRRSVRGWVCQGCRELRGS
jgi:hypothetical protein